MRYKSCRKIREGFNFYRSGVVSACCYAISPELNLARIDDANLPEKILLGQTRLIARHKHDDAPAVCRRCESFIEDEWRDAPALPFSRITLNHYKKCNLKCVHCGYRQGDDSEHDTDHGAVLAAIQACMDAKICSSSPYLEVGGGEPSLARGLEDIFKRALADNWKVLINSNGAKFSPLFAEGVNAGLFTLLLTPDAGTAKVYEKIKGVDYFDITWRNIGRYMAATSAKALVKFILEEGNKDDIPAMIETSLKYGVKNLVLSMDMNLSPERRRQFIPMIRDFCVRAAKRGLSVTPGAFLPAI